MCLPGVHSIPWRFLSFTFAYINTYTHLYIYRSNTNTEVMYKPKWLVVVMVVHPESRGIKSNWDYWPCIGPGPLSLSLSFASGHKSFAHTSVYTHWSRGRRARENRERPSSSSSSPLATDALDLLEYFIYSDVAPSHTTIYFFLFLLFTSPSFIAS